MKLYCRINISCGNYFVEMAAKMSVSTFILFRYDFRVIVRHFLLGENIVCVWVWWVVWYTKHVSCMQL